jgi:hypothetical protein
LIHFTLERVAPSPHASAAFIRELQLTTERRRLGSALLKSVQASNRADDRV